MQDLDANTWKKCSSCKKPISFGAKYYVCSVSTCNGQRTGYVFCGVPCFEVHLPSARHKDAAAIEMKAPAKEGHRRIVTAPATQSTSGPLSTSATTQKVSGSNLPREVLVIASRLKEYIQARSEMNTSQAVMDILSDFLRVACERAIENARKEGRKTVMERDFEFLRRG
jgi:histone H3/H4